MSKQITWLMTDDHIEIPEGSMWEVVLDPEIKPSAKRGQQRH